MLQLDVNLLTGRYVAAGEESRESHEWPPHPARLFSALVATWADVEEPSTEERQALKWLEQQAAPEIRASEVQPGFARTVVPHFVPVNDAGVIGHAETAKRAAKLTQIDEQLIEEQSRPQPRDNRLEKLGRDRAAVLDVSAKVTEAGKTNPVDAVSLLPAGRGKQPRHWPTVTPDNPLVSFVWPAADADPKTSNTLDSLASRLVRLGHSSSLVSARLTSSEREVADRTRWVPDPDGSDLIRWVQPGQVDALERRFADHQASKVRSLPAQGVRYRQLSTEEPQATPQLTTTQPPPTEWLTFEFVGADRRLPARRCVEITRAVRGALLSHATDSSLPALSGHAPNGAALTNAAHIGAVALPFVSGSPTTARHATGQILGVAVAIPAAVSVADRRQILAALGKWRAHGFMLRVGSSLALRLSSAEPELRTLESKRWRGPSSTWVTVTPLALPRHPGDLNKGSETTRTRRWDLAEEIVKDACDHAGLPEPTAVDLSRAPILAGTEPASSYPAFAQSDRSGKGRARLLLHAKLTFDTPVEGPVVVGSGRFFGLGLMHPTEAMA